VFFGFFFSLLTIKMNNCPLYLLFVKLDMFVILKYLEKGITVRYKALGFGMVFKPRARQTHLGSMPAQATLVGADDN
jgi:hypothetical protein